jgi:hypothetical protein
MGKFATARRLWNNKEIYVLTKLQQIFHLPPTDHRLRYSKGNIRLHNICNYIQKNPDLSQLFDGRSFGCLRMKMNRDAIRVVGSEAVNKCMNVPINLKSRDQYG